MPFPAGVAGLAVVGVVAGLSIPSAIGIWRSLATLARLASNSSKAIGDQPDSDERRNTLRTMVEYGLAMVLIVFLLLLLLPLISELFTLGGLTVPVSLLLLLLPGLAVGVFSFRIHRVLERAISDTFTSGDDGPERAYLGDVELDSTGSEPQPSEDPLLPDDNPLSLTLERMPERDELASLLMREAQPDDPEDDGLPNDWPPGDGPPKAEDAGDSREIR